MHHRSAHPGTASTETSVLIGPEIEGSAATYEYRPRSMCLFGGIEEEEMREMREPASDGPRLRGRDEFHRQRAAGRRRHRDRVELEWRARVHAGKYSGEREEPHPRAGAAPRCRPHDLTPSPSQPPSPVPRPPCRACRYRACRPTCADHARVVDEVEGREGPDADTS